MRTPPSLDPTRFRPIAPARFVTAYLYEQRRPCTARQVAQGLKSFLAPATVAEALESLRAEGELADASPGSKKGKRAPGPRLELTAAGQGAVRALLGAEAGKGWEPRVLRRLAIVTLGLEARRDVPQGRALDLPSAIIAVGYGLETVRDLSPVGVRSELVWRLLRAHLPPGLVGDAAPRLDRPGRIELELLARLAQRPKARKMDEAWRALAAGAVGAQKTNGAALAQALLQKALEASPPRPEAREAVDGAFAGRVLTVARHLAARGPFGRSVPIADVYDAYGRDFPDAGTLEAFKRRLVAAAERREVALARNDLPEIMSRELRERSAVAYGHDERHFVTTEGESTHA